MLLYNINTKLLEDKDIIVLNDGTQMFVQGFSDDGLIEVGYKRVIEVPASGLPKEMEHIVMESVENAKNYTINHVIKQKPLELIVEDFKVYVQNILDSKAKTKGYDNIVSVCSYAGYENEYQAEGVAFGKWRAHVWQWGYKMLADIQAGKRQLPSSFAEAVADMPQFD
jgi:hypothetical protein|nr:MAG TPA: hypothetical protein [Caudoviricetes sp.]